MFWVVFEEPKQYVEGFAALLNSSLTSASG
jgi:hypothetical protein